VQLVLTTSFVVPMVNASQRVSDVMAAVTVLTAATSQTAVRFCHVALCSKYKRIGGGWFLHTCAEIMRTEMSDSNAFHFMPATSYNSFTNSRITAIR